MSVVWQKNREKGTITTIFSSILLCIILRRFSFYQNYHQA